MKLSNINKIMLIIFLIILSVLLFKIDFLHLFTKESFVYGGVMKDSLIKQSLLCSGENQPLLPICKNNFNLF